MKYILITGLGRSGSKWLAEVLTAMKPRDMHVGHEMLFDFDIKGWDAIADNRWEGVGFWQQRHEALAKQTGSKHVLEVSSVPRHFLEGFHKVFSDGLIGLLVRDPRKVVPSIAERTHYGDPRKAAPCQRPDPAWIGFNVPGWDALPRLSKICWLWTMANEAVMIHAEHRVRLEDLVSSYEGIVKLCEWCGVDSQRSVWESFIQRRINKGSYTYPPFEKWRPEKQKDLLSICEHPMKLFNYT